MLPFALKVVWFILSIVGTSLSWLSLMALGSLVGCRWVALVNCLGLTLYQGAFCLGMIWRMNPYHMPASFCLAQTILMSIGLYIMLGASIAFSIGTSLHVLKPKHWGDIAQCVSQRRSFKWRPIYITPVIVYPLVFSALRIALVLKYNAAQPFDGMHCDVINPLLVRLAGFVLPWTVLLIPCSYLSVISTKRVIRILRHVERS
ncbi:hypothetical protein B0H13DRAFT_1526932, partial [Mycena leptocephala]